VRDENELPLREIARELREPVPVSESFDARVMRAVRALPRHRFGFWLRLTAPRTITIKPLTWGVLAASLIVFAAAGVPRAFGALHRATRPIATALFPSSAKAPVKSQRVQFVLVAPDAKKVAVVGDFNGWDAQHAEYQAKHRGGGVWSVTAPVPLGHHRYSFVVDDSVWVADPTAPRVVDNDFGTTNSAIVVEELK